VIPKRFGIKMFEGRQKSVYHSCCHDMVIWTSILEHDNSRVKPTNDNNECNTCEEDAADYDRDILTRNCESHDERKL